ncbi:MAG: glycoside hydrolase 43 family protein, partial [Halanaerobiales bacterium]|nr:glycoside hydrolase 43 family protein [Halanaerobiales bacterium]
MRKKSGDHVWAADLENGKYKNPVLHADYSDPDVIRVKDNFFMVASSFNCMPGLPILHSKDLVNWEIINHVYSEFPVADYNQVAHGKNAWAPAIRYHDGKYWVFVGDPDHGIFMSNTEDPFGQWSKPIFVKQGKGLIDTCPFWDDDGNAYLVHAYARSRAGFKNVLNLCRMSNDGTELLDQGTFIFDGEDGHPTTEGPKIYKRNGYYYIFAPAGGVASGWQLVLRSKNIYGPYEKRVVLKQGDTAVNGPHQGGYVELESGESWFVHFQDKDAYGRIVHLQPMSWQDDWPIIGIDQNKDGIGEPVMQYQKPDVKAKTEIKSPATSDDFENEKLGLQWQWQANPESKWYSLRENQDSLRLYTNNISQEKEPVLWYAPNLLLQKFPASNFSAETILQFQPEVEGERAGLLVMGEKYSYLGLEKSEEGLKLAQYWGVEREKRAEFKMTEAKIEVNQIHLKVEVKELKGEALCQFSYSFDGQKFKNFGKRFKAAPGRWIG